MSVTDVTLFLAMLALFAGILAVAIGAGWIGSAASPSFSQRWGEFRAGLGTLPVLCAGVVGVTMMLGSLYLSEIADLQPCRFCWYQRIVAYPLGIILVIAGLRKDRNIRLYGVVLAAIGMCLSTYHVLLERFPQLESSQCEKDNPCSAILVERMGFLTIPTMALCGFALIIGLLSLLPRESHEDVADADSDAALAAAGG